MSTLSKILLFAIFISANALAGTSTPAPITENKLNWISPPPIPGLRFAWVRGSETHDGLYLLRVKLAKGALIPPHTHPDERNSTVLVGTLYTEFGESFDKNNLLAIQAGEVYTVPAGVPHFLLAKDGDVVYQETGVGPTATIIIKPGN